MRIKLKVIGYTKNRMSRYVKALNIPSFRITTEKQIMVGDSDFIDDVYIDTYKWIYKY